MKANAINQHHANKQITVCFITFRSIRIYDAYYTMTINKVIRKLNKLCLLWAPTQFSNYYLLVAARGAAAINRRLLYSFDCCWTLICGLACWVSGRLKS